MLRGNLKRIISKQSIVPLRQQRNRFYQTTAAQTSKTAAKSTNYAPIIAITAILAGNAGYWFATQNNSRASQEAAATNNAQASITATTNGHSRQQVPIPAIPTRDTISKVFQELCQVLPAQHVSVDEESLQNRGYSNNSYHNEGAPNIVVYPSSTNDVVQIVQIANKYDIPIIPFSGGTSLEGHFSAPRGGICISFTEHMDQVVAFHPDDMDIVVQPGVQWENLNLYLKDEGLFVPIDPGPGACFGGMVGTSCSGTNAVRYGTIKDWVINLTVVTAEGKIVKTRQRSRKSSAGYDLTKLFIGSEGTLGVVTEITLKLAVLPQHETVAVCDFPTIRDAAAVVPDLVRAGVQIGAVELLDCQMMMAINLANPDLGHAEKPTLFFKFSGGSKLIVDHEIEIVSEITKKHHGGTFKYAKNQAEKDTLWEGRKVKKSLEF